MFRTFLKWLEKYDLPGKRAAIFVTCGDWDLNSMLPSQCHLSKIKLPDCFKSWINIKQEFQRIAEVIINRSENDLTQMLNEFGLKHAGKLHSGKDDVRSIELVVRELCARGTLKATTLDESYSKVMPGMEEKMEVEETEEDIISLRPCSAIEVIKASKIQVLPFGS